MNSPTPDRVSDRGEVLGLDRRQGILEVSSNTVLCAPSGDRVPKDPACQDADAVGSFMPTPGICIVAMELNDAGYSA